MAVDDFKIVSLYEQGLSIADVGRSLGTSPTTVWNALHRLSVPRRRRGPQRTITVDDHAFSGYNPHSCYWAGFIAADGNVYGNQLQVEIHAGDRAHLESLRSFLNSDIIVRTSANSCRFRVRSLDLVAGLRDNFGLVPNKSLVLQPPPAMPDEVVNHFVRGYFDGDGCISANGRNALQLEFFSGSASFLQWVADRVSTHVCEAGAPRVRIRRNSRTKRVSFCGGRQVPAIMRWLYADSTPLSRLRRKWIKTHELISDRCKGKLSEDY